MACAGSGPALTPLLIGAIFDRVLNPPSRSPVRLFTIPIWHHDIYLHSFMPALFITFDHGAERDSQAVVATGLCDYPPITPVTWASAVTDLRQDVFDRVVPGRASSSQFDGSVMSSIMNDLEKSAGSRIFWRTVAAESAGHGRRYPANRLEAGHCKAGRCCYLLVPTLLGAGSGAARARAGRHGRAESGASETLSGHRVKSLEPRDQPIVFASGERLRQQSALRVQQAVASPDRVPCGVTIVVLVSYAAIRLKPAMTTGASAGFHPRFCCTNPSSGSLASTTSFSRPGAHPRRYSST
jgi:hypothetical protein